MNKAEFEQLLKRYRDDTLQDGELEKLYAYIDEGGYPEVIDQWLDETFQDPAYAVHTREYDPAAVFALLENRLDKKKRVFGWWKAAAVTAAAAVILLLVTISLQRDKPVPINVTAAPHFDAPPGKNGAVLTLANGNQILLDSSANGVLAQQGNARLLKEEGRLNYHKNGTAGNAVPVYNMVTTPRGRQFKLVLSDGTQVLLNAGSSIRFPTVFAGTERRVEISGEAYLEVSQTAEMPFVIQLNKSEVVVLGTQFNVTDYSDEDNSRTTLLTGAVKLRTVAQEMVLRPGQQVRMERNNGHLSAKTVDTDQITAWTRGRLSFDNTNFADLMRQISRWYDVDVVYKGTVPDIHIGGSLHRNVNLSIVMEFLGANGVHYNISDKTITILP
ncbi:FecR family protein [Chitinophaga filiformis]|uniref:FecR protein n=1 Tax=Chitinophaga filiformis TaxID=104663 RepID=A0A1G7RUG8_CHIFI|nr:FecR family protein [Chitinophaga filiformis]SDG13839.1 FecR protein [Chitinophaga filiformis]